MSTLSMDINLAHQRHWPNRPASLASRAWLLMTSSGLQLILVQRVAQWLRSKRENNKLWIALLIPVELLRLVTRFHAKGYIANYSDIEEGIVFSDQGNIIFGPKKVGSGTVIGKRVTVGMAHFMECPEIGHNVWIGSDCVIYGAITIGDGATLLPNTVLTKSIPAGVVMQGNPARLVLRNFDNSELRERQDIDAIGYVNAKREQGA